MILIYLNILNKHKNVWHKFIFTDLIQNCWHSGCNDTSIEFIYNNLNTRSIFGDFQSVSILLLESLL